MLEINTAVYVCHRSAQRLMHFGNSASCVHCRSCTEQPPLPPCSIAAWSSCATATLPRGHTQSSSRQVSDCRTEWRVVRHAHVGEQHRFLGNFYSNPQSQGITCTFYRSENLNLTSLAINLIRTGFETIDRAYICDVANISKSRRIPTWDHRIHTRRCQHVQHTGCRAGCCCGNECEPISTNCPRRFAPIRPLKDL